MKIKIQQSKNQNLPKIWRKVKLGDAVDIIDGDRGKNYPKKEDFSNNGYCVFLDAKNVFGTEFDFSSVQFVTKEKDDLLRKGKLKRNDFVLTTRGTIGNIAYYGKDVKFNNIRINSGMVILRPKNNIIDQKFFNLYLISQKFEDQIESFQSGSAQPQLPIRDLKLFEINLPLLEEQKRIVSILYPIKNKIELNNKINQNLEQMAQGIFREWFVDFRFPGHEKSKFIDSEMGRIPEGWGVKKLNTLVKPQYGYTETTSEKKIGPKFLRVKDINKTDYIDWEDVPYCKINDKNFVKYQLKVGDIVIARMADPGKIAIVEQKIKAVFASYLIRFKIIDGRVKPYFMFYYLRSPSYQDFIFGASTGTTRRSANAKVMTDCFVVVPQKEILEKFEIFVSKIRRKINLRIKENQKLSSLRDLLLPKLMSGGIRI